MKNSKFRFCGQYSDLTEQFEQNSRLKHYGTSIQPSVGETVSLIEMHQFYNSHKSWVVGINFMFQINIWEIDFAIRMAEDLGDQESYRAGMKRIWFDVINNDDWQPFCAAELKNQTEKVDYQLAIGCSHGALLFYHIPKARRKSVWHQ